MLPFYNVLKEIYDVTMQSTPDFFKQNSELVAYSLGLFFSYSYFKSIQTYVFNSKNSGLEKALDYGEKATLLKITALTAISIFDNTIRAELQQHTTYTMGILGSFLGAGIPSLNDIIRRYKNNN